MNRASILLFASLIMTTATAQADTIRVYLQGGQSNGDGRAPVSGLPTTPVDLQQPQTDVAFFFHTQGSAHALDSTLTTLRPGMSETSGFGPEITFGRDLADAYAADADTSIAIIKYANGGTNLHTQWKAGGDATATGDGTEYVVFQNTVTAGLAAIAAANPGDTVVVSGMTWMQGESDTGGANAAAYQANLTAFIADIRATYGADLPFIIGEIVDTGTGAQTVRAAQAAVAAGDDHTALVSVDGFGLQDAVHFNAAGQQSLGSGFADQIQTLEANDTPTPTALSAGLAALALITIRRQSRSRNS